MASLLSILSESSTGVISGHPEVIATTSAIGTTTAISRFIIDEKDGEKEFSPKKVLSTLASSSLTTSSTVSSALIMNHNNQEYQRYINQLQQANVVRDTQEMIAAQSPEDLDELLAMIDAKEQELASSQQQNEKAHVKHL